jgi:electron transport complex protein RnfG
MAKKESTFTSMVITLFLVTLAASTALALVYEATRGPIEEAKRIKKMNAIGEVVPEFDNDPGSEVFKIGSGKDTLYFYRARMGTEISGIAVESYTYAGFSGLVKIMVGFLPDGSIHSISVLEHAETPGLGDKMIKSKSYDKTTGLSWSSQFEGKHPGEYILRVRQDDGDVDAITAATITSRAFCDAVQRAYDGLEDILASGQWDANSQVPAPDQTSE